MTILVDATHYDWFERPNANTLGQSFTGDDWWVQSGTDFSIDSGLAGHDDGDSNDINISTIETYETNGILQATFFGVSQGALSKGLVFRYIDNNNYLFMDKRKVYKVVGGVQTVILDAGLDIYGVSGDIVNISMIGSLIQVSSTQDGGTTMVNRGTATTFDCFGGTHHGLIWKGSMPILNMNVTDWSWAPRTYTPPESGPNPGAEGCVMESWSSHIAGPTSSWSSKSVVVDSTIFCTLKPEQGALVFASYNVLTNAWTQRLAPPFDNSWSHAPALTVHGREIWAWACTQPGQTSNQAFYSYNMDTGAWTFRGSLDAPRRGVNAEKIGVYTYLIGGAPNNSGTSTTIVLRFDHSTSTFDPPNTVAAFNHDTQIASSCSVGLLIFVLGFGGSFYEYSAISNVWTPRPNVFGNNVGGRTTGWCGLCSVEGEVWMSGGSALGPSSQADVRRFTGLEWVAEPNLPAGRQGHVMEYVRGNIWVACGVRFGGPQIPTGETLCLKPGTVPAIGKWDLGRLPIQ